MATDVPSHDKPTPDATDPVVDAARAYRDILDATGDAIVIHDAETGQILDVNETMLEMFGCTREEIGQLQPMDLSVPGEGASAEEALRLLRLAAAGQPQRFEWAARKRTGEAFQVEINLCRVEIAGQVCVLATVRDISARVAAENRLHARERDLRNLIENVPGLVYRCEVEEPWRMLYMSEGALGVTGRHAEAFVSGDVLFAEIVLQEDLPTAAEAVSTGVAHHEPFQIEYRIHHPDGSIHWVFQRGQATYAGSGKPSFLDGVMLDVTDRKQAEEASRQTEEQYRTLYAAMDEGFCLHVLVRGDDSRVTNYRIIDANPAFTRFTKIPAEQVIGKLASEAYGVPEAPYLELYQRVAETGHPEWFETYFAPLEKYFSISVFSPSPDVFATVFYDITARKKAEEALRESEKRFRAVFEQAAVGVAQIESKTGRFVRINRKYCDVVGYTPEEILARTSQEITHPEDIEEDLKNIRRLLAGEIRSYSLEKRYFRKDGSTVWVNLTVSPMWQPGEEPTLHVAVVEDITEHHKMEERLRQSEKMGAIGQLAGGVAHDFNNQLGAIQGYAELLNDRVDDPLLKRYAESILVASRRSADLTRQLLAFARKGQYQSLVVDMHAIVHEVVEMLERSIDKRIRIKQHLDANPSTVLGDPTQLQNALLNLGLNARDAMPEGGDLIFTTDVRDLDEAYCQNIPYEVPPGRYLQVRVADNGAGMSHEVQAHLFEPFFTTKEQGKGTGMGLAAVYGTVKNHRGFIEVSSELGRGTAIEFFIPLHEAVATVDVKGAGSSEAPHRAGRVLVVDDEIMIRDLAAEMLRAMGHQVTTCRDGSEALAYYELHWREIDLVILDMVMPGRSGRDTFLDMRRINPAIKALLSSGFSVDGDAQKILDEGVQGFLQKPYTIRELTTKVGQLLR